MTRAPIAALLRPRGVAVIGASSDPDKRGHQTIRSLQASGFAAPIYPINPGESEILGLPVAASITDIDGPVDLAVICTPASTVPGLLRDCGAAGVAAAVIIAAGFGESGADGRALEQAVAAAARAAGVRVVGPNTNGVCHLPTGLNLLGLPDPPIGDIALVCQSGNVGLSLLTRAARETEVGISAYVGIGNEADVRFDELVAHLRDDAGTQATVLYAEGFRDGRALLAEGAAHSRRKPLVCFVAGRSAVGRRSAQSHTGAVAAPAEVTRRVLAQAGATVVERDDEVLAVAETLRHQPPMGHDGVAILADGGGHATIAADALDAWGLSLPKLADSTRARLTEHLSPAASLRNPVDVAGATDRDPSIFADCLAALLADPAVGGVLQVGLFGGYGIRFRPELAAVELDTAAQLAALARDAGKPLVVHSIYTPHQPEAHRVLRRAGVPVHRSIETAARGLAALAQRGRFLATATKRSSLPRVRPRRQGSGRFLDEPSARRLVGERGLDVGPWRHVRDADAAARAAAELDGPVALKIVSPDVAHKSDVGGVLLDLPDGEAARRGFERLVERVAAAAPHARLDGAVVAPMAPSGVELLVGASTDATFGPVVTVGAGGTAVELWRDVTFRAVPLTRCEAEEMLDELTIAGALGPLRGRPAADRQAVVDLLLAVSELMGVEDRLVELDLNPVIVHPQGLTVADVRVVAISDESPPAVPGTAARQALPHPTDDPIEPARR